MAAGFPLAGLLSSEINVSTGIVSATAGIRGDQGRVQISAPVQPGNSGGPLLDDRGNVIGVVVGKLDAIRVAAYTGDIPQNINFAIKSGRLDAFLRRNGISGAGTSKGVKLETERLAQIAGEITAQVICDRTK